VDTRHLGGAEGDTALKAIIKKEEEEEEALKSDMEEKEEEAGRPLGGASWCCNAPSAGSYDALSLACSSSG